MCWALLSPNGLRLLRRLIDGELLLTDRCADGCTEQPLQRSTAGSDGCKKYAGAEVWFLGRSCKIMEFSFGNAHLKITIWVVQKEQCPEPLRYTDSV